MTVIKKENINKIKDILENEGVVIFPTDTVYGLGCLFEKDNALNRLYKIKQRGKHKKIPLLVSSKKMIKKIISGKIPDSMNHLLNQFSPGGLTYIIKAKKKYQKYAHFDSSIAVRIPDNHFLINLIKMLNNPLFATSANISGQKEINDIKKLKEIFEKKVGAIIPGTTKKDIPSTIISFMETPPFFIRIGAISKEKIRNHIITQSNILFVCSGNTCRSPMAEEYAKKISSDGFYKFKSAGTLHIDNAPISKNSAKIIKEFGGNPNKISTSLNEDLIEWSDLILTMAKNHKNYIKTNYGVNYVYTLGEFEVNKGKIFPNGKFNVTIEKMGMDIFDPVGQTIDFYYKAFNLIKSLLNQIKWKELDD